MQQRKRLLFKKITYLCKVRWKSCTSWAALNLPITPTLHQDPLKLSKPIHLSIDELLKINNFFNYLIIADEHSRSNI